MEPGRRPAGGAEDVVYCLYDGEADGGCERRGCVPTVGRRAARHRVIYMCVCLLPLRRRGRRWVGERPDTDCRHLY